MQEPQPRTVTISQQRREPVIWSDDRAFRILSIDGGGINGIFPAAILSHLEQNFLGGRIVGDYFDLIAGTSTGGILALGLGSGITATQMLDMYIEEGGAIFPPERRGMVGQARRYVTAQYERASLDKLLEQRLEGKTLRDSKYRLLIPSTEGRYGEVWVYKTPHHPDYVLDGDTPMSAVAAATSAAPTYFRAFEEDGYTFLDGGIWANNPAMAALVEALSCFTTHRDNIRILSIGCGNRPFHVDDRQARSGIISWRNIIEVAMHLQSVTSVNQAGLLIGPENLVRLNRLEESAPIALDDWTTAKNTLPREAEEVAQIHADRISKMFLLDHATPLIPLA